MKRRQVVCSIVKKIRQTMIANNGKLVTPYRIFLCFVNDSRCFFANPAYLIR